ncbi:membrane protein [Clostridium acetobutylicum]|nr:membrane protein [Clostridium acetobutylicum]
MAIFFFILGLLLFLVVIIICVIRKIRRKRIGYINLSFLVVAIATIIVSFIEIPVKDYSEDTSQKSKMVSNKVIKESKSGILNLYSLENGQSIVIQYNDKNILIDVPAYLSEVNDKNNMFNVLSSHNIKKIDMLILSSAQYKSADNILNVVGRYNIDNIQYADNSIEKTNLDKEITDRVKAVNDVKKSTTLPEVMKEKQSLFGIETESEKDEDGITLSLKLPKNVKGYANIDSYDKNIKGNSIYDHKIKIGYDANGYILIKITSDVSIDKD